MIEQKTKGSLAFRPSTVEDIPAIEGIFDGAKAYLKSQGSPQWQAGQGPNQKVIQADIAKKASYVLTLDNEIVGTIALLAEKDPVYEAIEGNWQQEPTQVYVALHHVAIDQTHRGLGLGQKLLEQAIAQAQQLGYHDIRIDTYPANQPMLHLIEKLGFVYRGMVYFPFENGERKAFQLM